MLDRRIVGFQRGRLEPKPQPRQGCAELVGRVADELLLRLERAAEPVGHVVERERDLPLLARPLDLRARVELAVFDPPRGPGERPQRSRELARQHPGEREAERERGQADADDDEHVPSRPLSERVDALGDADAADEPTTVQHRHGGVEELAAERVAPPRPLLGPAGQRGGDLRSVAVRGQPQAGARRVREQAAAGVDDDHAGAEIAPGPAHHALELRRIVEPARGGRGHDLSLRCRLGAHLGIHPAREAEHERDLERDEDEDEHVRERGEQAQPQAQRSSSGEAKRKPTPRTVWR